MRRQARSGLLAVVGAAAMLAALVPGQHRGATQDIATNAAAQRTPATLTAQTCPAPTHPGAGSSQPYQLAFTGTLSGRLSITKSPTGAITLPHIGGTFCGLLELPLEHATVVPQNLHLAPVSVTIARATVPATIGGHGVTVGSVSTTVAPNGGLNLSLAAPVAATTGLFGVSCVVPVDLDLSTAAPGGSALTGPLVNSHAVAAQTGFTIQPAVSTGTSGTCPYYLAGQVDRLLALPNTTTSATVNVSLDVRVP